jgi:hypothetical protein
MAKTVTHKKQHPPREKDGHGAIQLRDGATGPNISQYLICLVSREGVADAVETGVDLKGSNRAGDIEEDPWHKQERHGGKRDNSE